jgi:hypothetical protein
MRLTRRFRSHSRGKTTDCSITPAEREQAARKQDDIAKAMWAQYIEYTTNQN